MGALHDSKYLLGWIFYAKDSFNGSSRTNNKLKVKGKLKYLLLKITFEWKLQDLQEFDEQYNNQGSMIKFYKNITKHKHRDKLTRCLG